MEKRYLKTEEVAALLGISAFTVRKFIRQSKIKAIKVGKHFLIPEWEVTAFLEKCSQ